jgi:hypothetical protein
VSLHKTATPEAESKEKHEVLDPMPELTIASPYVHSRVDSNTFIMGNPMPESTLKVHKIEIFFGFDFEICIISLLVMSKYWGRYDFSA